MASYLIGDIQVSWDDRLFSLEEDSIMRRFRFDQEMGNGCDHISYKPILSPLGEFSRKMPIYANDCTEAFDTPNGKFIVCHWGTCRHAYGFYLEELLEGERVYCYVDPAMKYLRPIDTITLFSTAGLHSKFLQKGAAVFHSSFIEVNGEAILFAGPSGMGKSTQATLWERYGNARIINGDRTLLRKNDGQWYAYGYPCCGSSGICLNEYYPVKAIVLLAQGSRSAIIRPSAGKIVTSLMAGMQAYSWETRETERTFSIANEIVEQVPVFILSATPDAEAVNVLMQYLYEC